MFSFDLACPRPHACCKYTYTYVLYMCGCISCLCLHIVAHKKCNYVHKRVNEERKWNNCWQTYAKIKQSE